MQHRVLLETNRTELAPLDFLAEQGNVFAVFDAATQDSGNVSYGVQVGADRFFVKTAGSPDFGHDHLSHLPHDDRVTLLRNAIQISRAVADPALPALRHVVESRQGPMLVYEWVEGDLIRNPEVGSRFLSLERAVQVRALDDVFRVHAMLADLGWVASDFYDGSLLYDFDRQEIHVVDLDHYRLGPFTNEMGRMHGSSRFMAPEEFELGARVDQRTTVFTLSRTLQQLLLPPPGTSLAEIVRRGCETDPSLRYGNVAEFRAAWSASIGANLG